MPKLRDYLAADLASFFNLDEFAELHDIDGMQIPAIVDGDVLKVRSNYKSERYDGVYAAELAVYVRAADLPSRPVYGQQVRLDGKLYLVVESTEAEGILEIVLGANES